MKRKLLVFLLLLPLILFTSQNASAAEKAYAPSAMLATNTQFVEVDNRAKILRKFLEQYNSPMAAHADTFVHEADKNDIDWKLVAAIAGLESGFGKHMPYNSYNAWGWGVYGDNVIRFKNFDDGIAILSKGLRENYINKMGSDDVYVIGKRYASSPTWAQRVEYFMNRIEAFEEKENAMTLSISL